MGAKQPKPDTTVVFDSYETALAYYEAHENARSIVGNSPRPGMFRVFVGDPPPLPRTTTELYAPIQDAYDRAERQDRIEYEAELLRQSFWTVGAEMAKELGHTGLAAEMFVQGFAGVPAQVADPRAHNLEPVFRAGRAAKNTADTARRCRAAAQSLRSDLAFEEFLQDKYQVRPIPWTMPFGG